MKATPLDVYDAIGEMGRSSQLPQLLNIRWQPYLFIDGVMRLLSELGSSVPHFTERWISRIYLWHNLLLLND